MKKLLLTLRAGLLQALVLRHDPLAAAVRGYGDEAAVAVVAQPERPALADADAAHHPAAAVPAAAAAAAVAVAAEAAAEGRADEAAAAGGAEGSEGKGQHEDDQEDGKSYEPGRKEIFVLWGREKKVRNLLACALLTGD